jgi:peptidoglycan/xylan/chitin deacetylase (PgdA/CDA1 family)
VSGRAVRWLMSLAHRHRASGQGPRLTIVRHHRVYRDDERPLYRLGVRHHVFRAQLELLERLGLTPITVEDGLVRLAEGRPGHWVAMTFDDGYADNVELALPLLRAHGARATFYLTAGLMETRRAPWWDELAHLLERTTRPRLVSRIDDRSFDLSLDGARARVRAMSALIAKLHVPPIEQQRRLAALAETLDVADAAPCRLATWEEAHALVRGGMEIGAHTLNHPFLGLLESDAQHAEIAGSVSLISERLGLAVRGLAYPGGDYDMRSVSAARAAGLRYAVTTRAGDNAPDAMGFELRRRGLSEGACLGPGGRFSQRLAIAELDGAFDGLRASRRSESEVAA